MIAANVVVVGAGVFGAWAAHLLRRTGRSVALLEAHTPGHTRASSGGESRIIRMGYGPNELYTRMAVRSLDLWREIDRQASEKLFYPTGVLWTAPDGDSYAIATADMLERLGVPLERLSRADLERRYPQIAFGSIASGFLEPKGGVLAARRSVRAVVAAAARLGVVLHTGAVEAPFPTRPTAAPTTADGQTVEADTYVFACGPWLATLFPDVLADRLAATRQEVFFFGAPPGDRRFAPPALPTWVDFGAEAYGAPDLEGRGVKIGLDRHGPRIDPDHAERVPSPERLAEARALLATRFPALHGAPLLEARVCQYTNTSSGDFLVDRHPRWPNVWLVGGGSGHGFKHGPAVAEYLVSQIESSAPAEPRFTLPTKDTVQRRAVF